MPAEVRRNQWGHYMVVPPQGGKPVGYARATTVAKTLEDGGGLIPWKAAMAMTGMMRMPGLRTKFEALYSKNPDKGPWYGGDESKTAVKHLVEECAKAGGATDRADLGTALHAIVEQINRGETPTISQDATRGDVAAYQAKLAEYGIAIAPGFIETTVVLDQYRIAGTADIGCARIPGYGYVVADLKTGSNLDYSSQSIAVQLAQYAHGDAAYRQGDAVDGSRDERLPVADVRQDVAVVIHLPAGEGRCELYEVDIAAGWEAFERSMWARKWRSRRDVMAPLVLQPAAANVAPGEPAAVTEGMRLVLLEQVRALPADRQQVLRDSWPPSMPPLKTPGEHWTAERLTEVSMIVMSVATGVASNGVAPGAGEAGAAVTSPPLVAPGREATGTGSLIGSPASVPGDHTVAPGVAGEAPSEVPPTDAVPGAYLTVEAFQALDREEQARLIDSGHLPPDLRARPELLLELGGKAKLLPSDLLMWAQTQCAEAKLPSLAHDFRWTKTRGERFRRIVEAAQETWQARVTYVMSTVRDENELRELIVTVTDGKCEQASQLTAEQVEQVIAAAQGITFPCDWAELTKTAGLTKAAVQRQAKALGEELGMKVPSVIERLPADGPFALRLAQWIGEQAKAASAA